MIGNLFDKAEVDDALPRHVIGGTAPFVLNSNEKN